MSAIFDLTEEDKQFYKQEGHYNVDGCALAFINSEGEVTFDYAGENLIRLVRSNTDAENHDLEEYFLDLIKRIGELQRERQARKEGELK